MSFNLPKFAKFSSFGDKSIICEVCSVSIKNLNQFNFKHVRSEEHINNVKKYLMKVKDNDENEKIKNKNISEKNNDNIKNNNIEKDKNINSIDSDKIEIIKDNLLNFDKETIDNNIVDLPKDFYDDVIKKDKNETKEIKKEDKKIKISSSNNKLLSTEDINNDNLNKHNIELLNEAEEMIKNSKTIIEIMENYKKNKKEKKLISKKRKLEKIINDKNETKENLLEDILN